MLSALLSVLIFKVSARSLIIRSAGCGAEMLGEHYNSLEIQKIHEYAEALPLTQSVYFLIGKRNLISMEMEYNYVSRTKFGVYHSWKNCANEPHLLRDSHFKFIGHHNLPENYDANISNSVDSNDEAEGQCAVCMESLEQKGTFDDENFEEIFGSNKNNCTHTIHLLCLLVQYY
eukprot:66694_1